MGEPKEARPVKLFIGLLTATPSPLPRIRNSLERDFGPVELESRLMDFNFTTYYEPEMGSGLKRQFWGFRNLIDPERLKDIKLSTNGLEKALATGGKRTANLDPGYLTGAKVVLASTKDFAHRVYLGRGIYGELTLLFHHGKFESLPWTYPDYRSEEYHQFFYELRRLYLSQCKSLDCT